MPYIDFEAVKRAVSCFDVLSWYGWHPAFIEGQEKRGPCPLHGSTNTRSRSFAACETGFYCHSCRKGGDAIRLYATLFRLESYAAALAMCERIGLTPPCIRVGKHRLPPAEQ